MERETVALHDEILFGRGDQGSQTGARKDDLRWRKVGTKKMFGCPCYQANGNLFAFLVTHGIVITQLSEADRATLSRWQGTDFFQAGKKSVQNWIRIPIKDKTDLDWVVHFVRRSYKAALQTGKRTG